MISKLLGVDIPVTETEDGLYIILHDTLRRFVRENKRIDITCKPLLLSQTMCVFEATAKDTETGIVCTEIGESNPRNLKNALAKENPAIMAQYRAYDRALIQLLDLPEGKVYSNNEIQNAKVKSNNEDTKPETKSNDTNLTPDVVYDCEIRQEKDKFAIFDLKKKSYILRKNGEYFLFNTKEEAMAQLKKREEKRASVSTVQLDDEEELLIGAYKGKKYGEVKNDNEFKEFLNGLKSSKIAFGDEERMTQLNKLKLLAV